MTFAFVGSLIMNLCFRQPFEFYLFVWKYPFGLSGGCCFWLSWTFEVWVCKDCILNLLDFWLWSWVLNLPFDFYLFIKGYPFRSYWLSWKFDVWMSKDWILSLLDLWLWSVWVNVQPDSLWVFGINSYVGSN